VLACRLGGRYAGSGMGVESYRPSETSDQPFRALARKRSSTRYSTSLVVVDFPEKTSGKISCRQRRYVRHETSQGNVRRCS